MMMTMMFVIVKQMEKAIEVINVMVNMVMMMMVMMESYLESQCHQKYVEKMEMAEQIDIVQVLALDLFWILLLISNSNQMKTWSHLFV